MSTANLPSSIAGRVQALPGLKRTNRFSKRPTRPPASTGPSSGTVIVIVAKSDDDKNTIARDLHAVLSEWLNGTGDPAMSTAGEPRPGGKRTEEPLIYDELIIRRSRREVRLDQVSIELTKTEFDFLYHLASHPGIVLTRSEIVDACKGVDYPVTMRSVDVQIANLRPSSARLPSICKRSAVSAIVGLANRTASSHPCVCCRSWHVPKGGWPREESGFGPPCLARARRRCRQWHFDARRSRRRVSGTFGRDRRHRPTVPGTPRTRGQGFRLPRRGLRLFPVVLRWASGAGGPPVDVCL